MTESQQIKLFWQKRLFLPAIPKKTLLAKTHSFEQFSKKNDVIGNKTDHLRVPS